MGIPAFFITVTDGLGFWPSVKSSCSPAGRDQSASTLSNWHTTRVILSQNTKNRRIIRIICFALLLCCMPFAAAAEDFTNAIAAQLQHYVHAQLPHGCMVVGLVDEHGPRVVSCGDLDNGTDRQADGNTLFQIESASYAFFLLLLQDMVERGEMKPDDPVEKYLPASVKMPTYHGKQITLRHLAQETSGLRPSLGDAIDPERADAPF